MSEFIEPIDCRDNNPKINYAGKRYDERYGCEVYGSLAICHAVEWCVIRESEYGGGVYSWHHFREHAEYNAKVLCGRALPVDRKDGEVLIPELAKRVIERCLDRMEDNDLAEESWEDEFGEHWGL